MKIKKAYRLSALLGIVLIGLMGCVKSYKQSEGGTNVTSLLEISKQKKNVKTGRIRIDSVGTFDFSPGEINTVREDIFKPGSFSIFDILVYLDNTGHIDLDYHYNENLETHVIEAINGKGDWWYTAFYDGGWSESNAFRMDLYPYKDNMTIRIHKTKSRFLKSVYSIFEEEVRAKRIAGGKIIVPEVIIRGTKETLQFQYVEVHAHNLRNDIFKKGVVTAIDVIMTLGDQGKLTYDLAWYDSIGIAEVVQTYFVQRINDDEGRGRCGFVYESGSHLYTGFSGNHIHIPPDTRVINSPEYVEFFWICI